MTRRPLWDGQPVVDERRLTAAKVVLVALIGVTTLLPLVFVSLDHAAWHLNAIKLAAKVGAFVGSMLLVWQFLLGFRGVVSSVFPDLTWVVGLHKWLGQFGVPIILLHPVFIGLYYLQTRGQNIYTLDLGDPFSRLVLVGMVALALVAFVVVSSAFFRDRWGFRGWLVTHLSSYLIPPLMFVHSFLLGPTIQGTPLRYLWWFFAALVAVLFVHRLLHKLGVGASEHRVVKAEELAEDTTQVVMRPTGRGVVPALGQFAYVRFANHENYHPYTVSGFDDETGEMSVTVAKAGPQSARMQDVTEGQTIIVDGPYGVFTRPALASGLPLVMIAGGIGITPFRRLWQLFEREPVREAYLFYGNPRIADIAYREELETLDHVQVVHVIEDEDEDWDGETGQVTAELLAAHLPRELDEYVFLICGPPPMIDALEEQLRDAGVPRPQVRHEKFAG